MSFETLLQAVPNIWLLLFRLNKLVKANSPENQTKRKGDQEPEPNH